LKDRKNAVLAAIDDNWRQFRGSLDRLISEDMSKPGVQPDRSVIDIVGHVTSWEWELVTALDRYRIEPVGNIDQFNERELLRKNGTEARETIEEMEKYTGRCVICSRKHRVRTSSRWIHSENY